MKHRPILITGCARSGTSMTAGVFDACGAFGGVTVQANKNNAKGFFENVAIREVLVKPYLIQHGFDPMCQNPLPDITKVVPDKQWRPRVQQALQLDGYREDRPWYYKGAKMALVWPLWHAAFPDAIWVLVRRRDEQIIYSCMHTAFMRAYKDEAGWQLWIDEHKRRFNEMENCEGLELIEYWPEDMVAGDLTGIRGLVEACGLTWDEQAVHAFIDPKLFKERTP